MEVYRPHLAVLAHQCLNLLGQEKFNSNEEIWMIDCTFGAGGHSQLFLEAFPNLKILAFDQDQDAINNAQKILEEKKLAHRVQLVHTNFCNIGKIAQENLENKNVQIILADLGVSSHHFDQAERGFSYRLDGPLDMRMDQRNELTAEEVINTFEESELINIFMKYGEEPFAKKISQNIVEQRKTKVFKTTKDLEEVCFLSYPPALRHRNKHPALRVFQALRLFINQELEVLESSLPKWFDLLQSGGRLGVISFHSLEDRIVKHSFLNWSKVLWSEKCQIITKKPIQAGQEELIYNPRARSAKLRVIQRN